MGEVSIKMGNPSFQETLSDAEREYIRQGDNWISKSCRETSLKALRYYGELTFEDLQKLPENEREKKWDEIRRKWNAHCEEKR